MTIFRKLHLWWLRQQVEHHLGLAGFHIDLANDYQEKLNDLSDVFELRDLVIRREAR